MGDIVYKMGYQAPERLPGDYIFLSALLAKPPLHLGSAVQTVFFNSFLVM
jgi:hypothetical protein